MELIIRPATVIDAPKMIAVQNSAFIGNPADASMFPNRSEVVSEDDTQVVELGREMTNDTTGRWMVVVDNTLPSPPRLYNPVNPVGDDDGQEDDVDHDDVNNEEKGDIISWAKWEVHLEHRPESEWRTYEIPKVEEGANVAYTKAFVQAMAEHKWRLFQGRPFLYNQDCQILVTAPSHQRRGAASSLLDWGCQQADRSALPAYVESSLDGYPLYLKFGFEVVGEHIIDLTLYGGEGEERIGLLLRKPQPTS